jgi:hypothetical protein
LPMRMELRLRTGLESRDAGSLRHDE